MGKIKTRHICDLTFCRHINTENICTIGNQENCVYYRTLQALNGYKAIAKWCDDCKKVKELESQLTIKIINCIKFHLCKQDEDYDKSIISPKFLSDTLDQMTIDGFEEIKENDKRRT